ncbi:MAG: glycosyltransferase family 4 protein [Vicinamibacterales bacterium]
MHIAFFNRSYYPDQTATGQLLTELCEELVREHGCQVSVITGRPLHPVAGADRPDRSLVARDAQHGVRIFRARGTRFSKSRFAGRACNYLTYFLSACYAGLRLDAPDVVVALTDPPIVGLAAWLARLRFGAPLVMVFQDVFPEVTIILRDFQSPAINSALRRVNRFLVRRAARNVAIGETMRQRLIEDKGAPPDRTVVIANWADTSAIQPGPRDNAWSRAFHLTGKFVVMHSGNLGLAQNLETLVDAAALLREVPDVQVVLQGDGVKKPALLERVKTLNLTNVTFLPFAPKDALGDSFAAADLFVIGLERGLAGYIVPSKVYGILAAGRPFIAAVEPTCEVASMATEHDCGVVVEPGDARALADGILACYRDRERTARLGANARTISHQFDRARQAARYADLFRELAHTEPVGASARGEEAHVGRG